MNHKTAISAYLWLFVYVIVSSTVSALLTLFGIDPFPWLAFMVLPFVAFAIYYPPSIYRIALLGFALNVAVSRMLWPPGLPNGSSLRTYASLITVISVVELVGILSRRQRALVQEVASTEAELRKQQDFLQLILDSSPNLISVRDREERYVLVNHAAADLLGKSTEQIIGKKIDELLTDSEMLKLTKAENQLVFESGETQFLPERYIVDNKGQNHWYQVTKAPLRDKDGTIKHILIVGDELTRQKLASEELKRNNVQFRALAESAHALLEKDFDVALQKALAILGEALQIDCIFIAENLGVGQAKIFEVSDLRTWFTAPHPLQARPSYPLSMPYFPTFSRLHAILSVGQTVELDDMTEPEREILEYYGARSLIAMPIQVNDEFWGVAGVMDWLHPREWKEYERNILSTFISMLGGAIARQNDWHELRRQEEFTRSVLSALPVDVFVKDIQGRFVMINRTNSIRGNNVLTQRIGKTSSELFEPSKANKYVEEDQFVILTGQTYVSPVEAFVDVEQNQRWRQIEKSPIFDANGNLTHIVGVQYDRTEQIIQNEELRRAKEAAEAATRAKSAFLANMSHEIRTPMNAVIGMTSVLNQTQLDTEQQECVETIRNSGETLLGIINQILDFSKIESEQLELEEQPFNLIECLEHAIDLFAHNAYAKGLELVLSLAPNIPTHIKGDLLRLRQVLVNLLDNAIKFTERGEVVLTVTLAGAGETVTSERMQLHFSVKDSGIGISEEEQQRLFRSFSQVDTSITRRYGGTGLGLAICKRLCELMQGDIWIESNGESGATFHFTISAEAILDRPAWLPTGQPLGGKHILLLIEHIRTCSEIRQLLERAGATVTIITATSQAQPSKNAGIPVHLLISERSMGNSGVIKMVLDAQSQQQTTALPLLLLTTVGEPLKQEEFQAECNCVPLSKPVKPTELLEKVTRLVLSPLRSGGPPSGGPPSGGPVSGGPLPYRSIPAIAAGDASIRILLVEDNAVNRRVSLRLLQKLGYQADVAAHGEEAVNLLLRQPYDILLMDAHMPVMGGLEATQRIRSILPANKQPYIIGVTADALVSFRDECLTAGMNDYLVKPVGIELLADALKRARLQLQEKEINHELRIAN